MVEAFVATQNVFNYTIFFFHSFLAFFTLAVWCRRTDELVDGPNASHLSSSVLDRWEERLEDIFDGRPYDMLDAALTDTVHNFPLDIKVI